MDNNLTNVDWKIGFQASCEFQWNFRDQGTPETMKVFFVIDVQSTWRNVVQYGKD